MEMSIWSWGYAYVERHGYVRNNEGCRGRMFYAVFKNVTREHDDLHVDRVGRGGGRTGLEM